MKYFNYKNRDLSTGHHFLGTLLIFAGLFILLAPYLFKIEVSIETVYWLSAGAVFIGTCIVSYYRGTLIHLTDQRFKEYTSFLGYKFGEWHELPELSGLKSTSQKRRATNTINGISPTLSGEVVFHYLILLGRDHQPELTFSFTNKKRADKHQKRLQEGLGLMIV